MPIRDAGLSFVDSMSALTPHPSIPTLVLYASDRSKTVVLAVHEMSKKYLCAVSVFLRQHQRPRLWMFSVTEVGVDCWLWLWRPLEQAVHKVYFLAFYVFELCPVEPAKKMLLLYALNPNSASCSMQTRVLEKIKK